MEITQTQYERIADCFPVHRGNVSYDNLKVLNAILYVMENGCPLGRAIKGSQVLLKGGGYGEGRYGENTRRMGAAGRIFVSCRQEKEVERR